MDQLDNRLVPRKTRATMGESQQELSLCSKISWWEDLANKKLMLQFFDFFHWCTGLNQKNTWHFLFIEVFLSCQIRAFTIRRIYCFLKGLKNLWFYMNSRNHLFIIKYTNFLIVQFQDFKKRIQNPVKDLRWTLLWK